MGKSAFQFIELITFIILFSDIFIKYDAAPPNMFFFLYSSIGRGNKSKHDFVRCPFFVHVFF